jgi:nucleotide-binding universal stress UspA family protein
MHIVAATDFSTRSHRAVRRAGVVAQARKAALTVLHVVDDDQPERLVEMEKRESERILTEQVAAMAELQGLDCRPLVVTGNPFEGILRAADLLTTDLIVMGTHRKRLFRDIVTGTTIERVIRSGHCPVLMVNNEAARPYQAVLAPVDMSKPSAHGMKTAQALGLTEGARTTVLHGFIPLAKAKMTMAGVDRASLEEYTAGERHRAAAELRAFVALHGFSDRGWRLRVEEGPAVEVISHVLAEEASDLLVLGTHGRTGLLRVLLGSVTEEALRSLDVDILAVPPPNPGASDEPRP